MTAFTLFVGMLIGAFVPVRRWFRKDRRLGQLGKHRAPQNPALRQALFVMSPERALEIARYLRRNPKCRQAFSQSVEEWRAVFARRRQELCEPSKPRDLAVDTGVRGDGE